MDPTATLALLRRHLRDFERAQGRPDCDLYCPAEEAADAYEAATNLDRWLLRGGFRPPEDPEGAECQRLITAASEAAAVVLNGAHQEVFLHPYGWEDDDLDLTSTDTTGWFYWTCLPGCLPDSEPFGPYDTAVEAVQAALDSLSN